MRQILGVLVLCGVIACGGGGGADDGGDAASEPVATPPPAADDETPSALDTQLRTLLGTHDLIGDAAFNRTLPSIDDPLPQLGLRLFFSKSLGGEFDSACVSCHHPMLGGGDDLSLPVGVHAQNPDLLGLGREHVSGIPNVPRNSPTVFNLGLWDSSLFWDSRVESFGKEEFANGSVSDIRTPDVTFGAVDPQAGANLAVAQARFPVTSAEEMRTDAFVPGGTNQELRDHLAARIGGYGVGAGELITNDWLALFQTAFGASADAQSLVTFDNIALALGEYERSMVFVDNAFSDYVNGDDDALTEQQKEGAVLFFTEVDEGGAGCVNCHSGDKFTDERHHTVAFPQIGPGKGDDVDGDFGRERETGDLSDRFRFRTPSLLNVAVTAPYGHAGAYATLDDVLDHYDNPRGTVDDFFDDGGACQLPQFLDTPNCDDLYPNGRDHSEDALDKLAAERQAGDSLFIDPNLNGDERDAIVAFLESLTDPCVLDRNCMSPWIAPPQGDPDGQQLDAVDAAGNVL